MTKKANIFYFIGD